MIHGFSQLFATLEYKDALQISLSRSALNLRQALIDFDARTASILRCDASLLSGTVPYPAVQRSPICRRALGILPHLFFIHAIIALTVFSASQTSREAAPTDRLPECWAINDSLQSAVAQSFVAVLPSRFNRAQPSSSRSRLRLFEWRI
ncbi:hypothetical protein AB1N83_008949 [Pleurotus pulmonarius]